MKCICYTHVDSKTGVPTTQAPAKNGPRSPVVAGLEFLFAEESRYPTDAPVFYGVCPDDSDISVPGVLGALTEDAYEFAKQDELSRRKIRLRRQVDAIRDVVFFSDVPYLFPGDEVVDAIQYRDDRDRQNIQDTIIEAMGRPGGDVMSFMPRGNVPKSMTAAQILDMQAVIDARRAAIYAAAWGKKAEIEQADSFDALRMVDLQAGWPGA